MTGLALQVTKLSLEVDAVGHAKVQFEELAGSMLATLILPGNQPYIDDRLREEVKRWLKRYDKIKADMAKATLAARQD